MLSLSKASIETKTSHLIIRRMITSGAIKAECQRTASQKRLLIPESEIEKIIKLKNEYSRNGKNSWRR